MLLVNHFTQKAKQANAMKTPFDIHQTHSHTQAFYRFVNNEKVTLADLSEPLIKNTKLGVANSCDEYALVMHDWSRIAVNHENKQDKLKMTHKHDVGYELQSSLVVSDQNGLAIAPIAQNLITSAQQLSIFTQTRDPSQ